MHDLNDMRYFAEVVERGSFSGAARALDLPTSRLSRRIGRLEAELGVRLLNRTTRKLSLTLAGEQFIRHCIAVRDTADQAYAEISRIVAEPRGGLRVSCPVTLAQTVIGPLIPAYLKRCPYVKLNLEVTNRVVDLVSERVDIALRVRLSLDDSGSAIIKRLGRGSTWLIASPELLQRVGRPEQPADLKRFDAVGMSAQAGRIHFSLDGPQGAHQQIDCAAAYIVDDLVTLRYAIEEGIGVGFMPDYMCREGIAQGRLEQVLPEWSLRSGIVHAAYMSRRGMSPAVRSFLDYMGEVLADDQGDAPAGLV
ncbi:LysR substrate-binding domain-containing protein [Castellaniella sp.]|uniref:LysR substrate-binding domain-containing protein n=1 Tax=Castellaniella sp. TaxID=1955812 RepID=UPI003C79648D